MASDTTKPVEDETLEAQEETQEATATTPTQADQLAPVVDTPVPAPVADPQPTSLPDANAANPVSTAPDQQVHPTHMAAYEADIDAKVTAAFTALQDVRTAVDNYKIAAANNLVTTVS